jgi:rod shape determining protein RodA
MEIYFLCEAAIMWNIKALSRIDFRVIPVIAGLMIISLLVISAYSLDMAPDMAEESFFTPTVRSQIQWFVIGSFIYLFFACLDYHRLRNWTWILYAIMILSLVGLFFTDSVQRVHRWYKVPFVNFSLQPSELAKTILVIALSWFLERRRSQASQWGTAFYGGLIAGIPFILILKQPDLGTALILFPIVLVIFYLSGARPIVIKVMAWMGAAALVIVAVIFTGLISHEELRPYATLFLKDYQFDRLDPHTHHQKAALTAIAVGGLTGTGWRKSEFTAGGWLPASFTDSVFPAFGEEYGFVGLLLLLALFYALIYFSFQVALVAKDEFGRLLAAGISTCLAMGILVNIGMMTGFLPITGVPLVLVTYGGSSVLSTMMALGILQSIYSRRFMF